MLAETDLDKLGRQLFDFNLATKARQDALDELTLTYGKLLEDYRTLRSDYEEEKESREKYKKLARGQDRNPFVLVLIDADGYVVSRWHCVHVQFFLLYMTFMITFVPADNKNREMFRLFVENNQFKHIFFAGCHDTGYLNLLTPYVNYHGKNEKITLVRSSSFSPKFDRLGLDIDSLNGLFHNKPLDGLDARRAVSKLQ